MNDGILSLAILTSFGNGYRRVFMLAWGTSGISTVHLYVGMTAQVRLHFCSRASPTSIT